MVATEREKQLEDENAQLKGRLNARSAELQTLAGAVDRCLAVLRELAELDKT